jgi:hypothetical protein
VFTVININGRTPPCENCGLCRAEKGIEGDKPFSKLKLCRPCYHDLVTAIDKHESVGVSPSVAPKFHAHLDECKQCREHPFGLCSTGSRLLTEMK